MRFFHVLGVTGFLWAPMRCVDGVKFDAVQMNGAI